MIQFAGRLAGWTLWGALAAIGSTLDDLGIAATGMADEIGFALDRHAKAQKRKRRNTLALDRTLREIESLPT